MCMKLTTLFIGSNGYLIKTTRSRVGMSLTSWESCLNSKTHCWLETPFMSSWRTMPNTMPLRRSPTWRTSTVSSFRPLLLRKVKSFLMSSHLLSDDLTPHLDIIIELILKVQLFASFCKSSQLQESISYFYHYLYWKNEWKNQKYALDKQ